MAVAITDGLVARRSDSIHVHASARLGSARRHGWPGRFSLAQFTFLLSFHAENNQGEVSFLIYCGFDYRRVRQRTRPSKSRWTLKACRPFQIWTLPASVAVIRFDSMRVWCTSPPLITALVGSAGKTRSDNGTHHFNRFTPEHTLLARAGDPQARLWRNFYLLQILKNLDDNFETFPFMVMITKLGNIT